MTEATALKYVAFLSYSHSDRVWGEWLHKAIETYRVPRDLKLKGGQTGTVATKLRPIFRDRFDLEAGHSLGEQILEALTQSEAMIVLCSPRSAKSAYVNDEIRKFKALGRSDRVFAIIVEGEPGHPELECFPPALRYAVGPDGRLTEERVEPVAADAREVGDGRELARLKLIAGLLNVDLDDLRRREQADQRRQKRFWALVAGLMAVLAVGAAVAAVIAQFQYERNQTLLASTFETASGLIETSVRSDREYGLPVEATIGVLQKAGEMFDDIERNGDASALQRRARARLNLVFAESYGRIANTSGQISNAAQAVEAFEKLAGSSTSDLDLQHDLSEAHLAHARAMLAIGQYGRALDSLAKAKAIKIDILGGAGAAKLVWRKAYVETQLVTARLLSARGAENDREAALAVLKGLQPEVRLVAQSKEAAGDRSVQELLADVPQLMAEIYRDGFIARREAYDAINEATVIVQGNRQLSTHPTWRRREVELQIIQGDVLMSERKSDAGLAAYRQAREQAIDLARSDPSNASLRLLAQIALTKTGNALDRLGRTAEGKQAHITAVTAIEELHKANELHAGTLLSLFAALDGLGNLLVESERSYPEGLGVRQRQLAVAQKAIARDADNIRFKQNLASAQIDHGLALTRMGRSAEAIAAMEPAVYFRRNDVQFSMSRGLKDDRLRRLTVALEEFAEAHIAADRLPEAVALLEESLAARRTILADQPDNAQRKRNVAASLELLGTAAVKAGACQRAVDVYTEAERLIAEAISAVKPPVNPAWPKLQGDIRDGLGRARTACPPPRQERAKPEAASPAAAAAAPPVPGPAVPAPVVPAPDAKPAQ